jgi:hypothetical protein
MIGLDLCAHPEATRPLPAFSVLDGFKESNGLAAIVTGCRNAQGAQGALPDRPCDTVTLEFALQQLRQRSVVKKGAGVADAKTSEGQCPQPSRARGDDRGGSCFIDGIATEAVPERFKVFHAALKVHGCRCQRCGIDRTYRGARNDWKRVAAASGDLGNRLERTDLISATSTAALKNEPGLGLRLRSCGHGIYPITSPPCFDRGRPAREARTHIPLRPMASPASCAPSRLARRATRSR